MEDESAVLEECEATAVVGGHTGRASPPPPATPVCMDTSGGESASLAMSRRTLLVRGLPLSANLGTILTRLSPFGEITDVSIDREQHRPNHKRVIVTYSEPASASRAIEHFNSVGESGDAAFEVTYWSPRHDYQARERASDSTRPYSVPTRQHRVQSPLERVADLRQAVDHTHNGFKMTRSGRLLKPLPLKSFTRAAAFRDECSDLRSWTGGTTHAIPLICEYMKRLSGCTVSGAIYWREEANQVASILLRELAPDSDSAHPGGVKPCIVIGSPGVGKSVMLVVLAFYLALVEHKNVFVVRTWREPLEGYDVVYMGYVGTEPYHFGTSVESAAAAADLLENVRVRYGKPCLLLDGFEPTKIPDGLRGYQLLSMAQMCEIDPHTVSLICICLLPSWRKEDIFKFGDTCYGMQDDDMERRFYYSGGDVRLFEMVSVDDVKDAIDAVIKLAVDPGCSFSQDLCFAKQPGGALCRMVIKADSERVSASYTSHREWENVLDSEYALDRGMCDGPYVRSLFRFFRWARATTMASRLTSRLFHAYTHECAAENRLYIHMAKYKQQKLRAARRKMRFTHVMRLYQGDVTVVGDSTDRGASLRKWRDDPKLVYWRPEGDDSLGISSGIDSVGKLYREVRGGGTEDMAAYLKMTVAASHVVDMAQLRRVNEMYGSSGVSGTTYKMPIYVVLCADQSACEALQLTIDGADGTGGCEVYVGYVQEPATVHFFKSGQKPPFKNGGFGGQ